MSDHLPQDAGEKSLWGATANANPVSHQLEESIQADVLVVGGGYTGLSSALHLAEQGVSVVLLEAKSTGFGGSGRNAGLVNAGVWQNPEHVNKELGEAAGERFNMALRDSPALVFELVRRFDMSCDANQSGTVNIAHKRSDMTYLEDRCRQMQALGATVEMIDGASVRGDIGISGISVTVESWTRSAGTIHPLNYVRGLAKAALDQGARLFQESGVESLSRHNDRWLATTSQGEVSADQVIIATNAYADKNSEQVQEIDPSGVYFPVCDRTVWQRMSRLSIIPQRHGLWDTQTLMTSSRIDSDGRLVMSSAGRLQGLQRGNSSRTG